MGLAEDIQNQADRDAELSQVGLNAAFPVFHEAICKSKECWVS